VVSGQDGGVVELDAVTVPDLVGAPSSCSTIQGIYDVAETDCGIFSERFGIKQRGCVAVLVDLVGGDRPAARVTKSGLSFDFLDAGLTRSCLGQLDGESIVGECAWTEGSCTFTFEVAPEPEPNTTPGGGGGGGGGCSSTNGSSSPLLLFMLILTLPFIRRTSTMKQN
jgi:hypothetical protein